MPALFNPNASLTGIDPRVLSVRYWLWPSVTDRSAEATAAQAHFVEFEGYDRRQSGNQNPATPAGVLVAPLNRIETWPRTCMEVFQATTVEELLRSAFPPPTAD